MTAAPNGVWMSGGSIGHCTTGSVLSWISCSDAASIRDVSTGDCGGVGSGAVSVTSCKGALTFGAAAISTSFAHDEATPDCPVSTSGSVLNEFVVTIAFSAPLLRARLTPAMSVQRAAFSAMLRSVSWTLAGGVTFCAVAIGRV